MVILLFHKNICNSFIFSADMILSYKSNTKLLLPTRVTFFKSQSRYLDRPYPYTVIPQIQAFTQNNSFISFDKLPSPKNMLLLPPIEREKTLLIPSDPKPLLIPSYNFSKTISCSGLKTMPTKFYVDLLVQTPDAHEARVFLLLLY